MSTTSRKLKEKEDRHRLILDAAEKIIKKKGISGLQMDLIAQETELAKGTIYLYFKSKDEILNELILKARYSLLEGFIKATKNINSPLKKLLSIIQENFDFNKRNPTYFELITLAETKKAENDTDALIESSRKISAYVIDIIIEGQKMGEISKNINPLTLSISMWGMTIGMMQLIKIRGTIINKQLQISQKDILLSFIDLFEKGIKA